jgi:hypothetical protein
LRIGEFACDHAETVAAGIGCICVSLLSGSTSVLAIGAFEGGGEIVDVFLRRSTTTCASSFGSGTRHRE